MTSDRHIDHPDSDWELQLQHLDEAASTSSPVLDAGDLLCVMQSKFDKRSSKSSIRIEHLRDNYLDQVVATTAEKLAPWAHLMPVILSGNHEHAIVERYETSLTDRLCERLKALTGATVHHGGYGAAITFQFGEDGRTYSVNMWMEHGAGGGAPVTGDLIAMFRKATYLPDFSIVCSGHTHDKAVRSLQRLRLSDKGRLFEDELILLKLGTYKREFHNGRGGWATRRGMAPKPAGAWWVEFTWDRTSQRVVYKIIPA